ncbi:hypothetical protein BGZ99_002548, partial [Dissophora globulifera]
RPFVFVSDFDGVLDGGLPDVHMRYSEFLDLNLNRLLSCKDLYPVILTARGATRTQTRFVNVLGLHLLCSFGSVHCVYAPGSNQWVTQRLDGRQGPADFSEIIPLVQEYARKHPGRMAYEHMDEMVALIVNQQEDCEGHGQASDFMDGIAPRMKEACVVLRPDEGVAVAPSGLLGKGRGLDQLIAKMGWTRPVCIVLEDSTTQLKDIKVGCPSAIRIVVSNAFEAPREADYSVRPGEVEVFIMNVADVFVNVQRSRGKRLICKKKLTPKL